MKTKIPFIIAAAVCSLLLTAPSGLSQGSLTPPGPPAPTMITLSQIEPRTPISSPYTITQPGSYYLTTNLNLTYGDAINIETNGVTLDLNGFTISSTSTTFGTAILLLGNDTTGIGNADITISNGHITGGVTYDSGTGMYSSGPGFVNGISYNGYGGSPYNVRVTGVTVSGCANDGINLGTTNSTIVESCTVNTVGVYGIVASSVSHSTAYQCGDTAITADTATDCYGYSTGGDGLDANYAADNCYGNSSSANGIYVSQGNADNCYGNTSSSGYMPFGLYAGNNAENCYGNSVSNGYGFGLDANSANNCYGNSNGYGNGLGAINANNCNGASYSGTALEASDANNCNGQSVTGIGINAVTAFNCYCDSNTSTGLASEVAIGCYCASVYGVGINSIIANSCYVEEGTESITYKYNMP